MQNMKGIIYTRVSSDEQVKGTSLDTQEAACRAYCESRGIEVLKVFREEGASAKTAERKILIEALEYCRINKGKVQAFVVWKLDRFARDSGDHHHVKRQLKVNGTTLHSATESIGETPTEEFLENMIAAAAQFDNGVRRQRSMNGMKAKLLQGIWPWRPPLGYIVSHFNRQDLKKTEPNHPDPIIFPIVQKGLKAYATGNFSQAEIVRMFEADGLHLILKKKRLHQQMLQRIVTYQIHFYAGILVNPWPSADGKDQYVKGLHKPMITEDELERILVIRTGRMPNQVKKNRFNPKFTLRRTVLCATCGHPLTGSSPMGRRVRYPYYHCYNRDCPRRSKGIPAGQVEDKFVEELFEVAPSEEQFANFSAIVLEEWAKHGAQFNANIDRHNAQLAVLEKQRERVYEMREDGSYTPEEFRERKTEVENKISEMRVALASAKMEQFDLDEALSFAKKQVSDLPHLWKDLSPELRLRFQKLVFPEGISYSPEKSFGIAKLGCIFELSQLSTAENSQLGCLLERSGNYFAF